MTNAARLTLAGLAVLFFAGCSFFTPAAERKERAHYAANEYPANGVPGLKTVGLVVLDASLHYRPDLEELTTAFFVQLQSVEGLEVLPTSITLNALAEPDDQGNPFVLPRDGLKFADHLHVDGLFVAVVTDYSPYGDPVLSLGLMLFSRKTAPLGAFTSAQLDRIRQGGRPIEMPRSGADNPVTAVYAVYDASQKTTRRQVELYALGQNADDVGWERYYKVMPNYMRFASYEIVWKLFNALEEHKLSAAKADD
jgi:hypothetical protein